ncbi:MAG TPA: hypothetical protein VFS08_08430 [Gemmatimonadaceae bacterium]|nr:hypothetical protein [Gemmatimonadaceae bacterium]
MQQSPATSATPAPSAAPAVSVTPSIAQSVPGDGEALTASGPAAILEALKAQREELRDQLSNVSETRSSIAAQLRRETLTDVERTGLEQRLTSMDQRIAELDKQLAESNAAVARASAIPGAVVPEPPPPPRSGPDEDMIALGMFLTFAAALPLVIAYARRIWRRSAKLIQTIPPELYDRLSRIEQGMDAVAVEVERIGEGQRFMTRLFNEMPDPRAIGAGAAQPIDLEAREGERVGRG